MSCSGVVYCFHRPGLAVFIISITVSIYRCLHYIISIIMIIYVHHHYHHYHCVVSISISIVIISIMIVVVVCMLVS